MTSRAKKEKQDKPDEEKKAPKAKHEVYVVSVGEEHPYLEGKCRTCNRMVIIGGHGAEEMLRRWANYHSAGTIVTIVSG